MKKVNKALMATVAILLSLVLISTSVVSGIFAKFVETKSAGATVSLKAFGLTLTVDKGSAVADGNVSFSPTGSTSATALSATVSYDLNAEYTYRSLLIFSVSGTPNVDKVKLVLTIKVDGVDSFSVAENEVPGIPAGNHIPVGFLTRILPDSWRSTGASLCWRTMATNEALEHDIINGIIADVNNNSGTTSNPNPLYPLYNKNDPTYEIKSVSKSDSNYVDTLEMVIWDTGVPGNKLQIESIDFAVRPFDYNTGTNKVVTDLTREEAGILQTYLTERTPAPQLKLTYTVSLEQVIPTTTNS